MIVHRLPQRLGKCPHCRKPLTRLLGQRPGEECLDAAGYLRIRVPLAQRRHRIADVRPHGLHRSIRQERRLARKHLVKHDSQRIEVAGRHHHVAESLLGTQVLRRTNDHPGASHVVYGSITHELGDAEIKDLQLFAPLFHRHEEVVRLEIPVEDVVFVGLFKGTACLEQQTRGADMFYGSFVPDDVGERPALEQLHRVVQKAVAGDPEVVQCYRVAAVERRNGPGFVEKPLDRTFVLYDFPAQHLQRNDPLDEVLFGLVNHPHAAPSDALHHCVALVENLTRQVLVHGRNQK